MTTPTKTLRLLMALACVAGCASLRAAVVCSFNGAVLSFAPYDSSNASPNDSVGSVDLQCTNLDPMASSGVTLTIGLSGGGNGTVGDRKMSGNGNLLRYGIYRDGTRSFVWGEGMDAVQQSSGPLAPNQTTSLRLNLFARIPAQQNVRAGLYQDQLIFTVTP